ncbi:MAG: hypothetical protein ACQBVK_04830, partial [Candidatus Phytoplasma sp. TWB_XP]
TDQLKYRGSQFGLVLQIDPNTHTIEVNYKGPKWLLEEDKDFYMDEMLNVVNLKVLKILKMILDTKTTIFTSIQSKNTLPFI